MSTFLDERDAALIAMDVERMRKLMGMPEHARPLALLAGMHKARYNIPSIPAELRHESAAWLRAHGLTDIHGIPLLPPGQLPE